MFVLRSTSLCLDLCVYVLRAILMCLDLCWLLYHVLLKPFHLLISLFLMFCPHFLCMSMFACLLLCFFSMLASLDLGLAMLCAPRGFAYMVTSFPPTVCLDVTTCEIHLRGVGVHDSHFSSLRPMLICLPCLLCATHLDFFVSLHLCLFASLHACLHVYA